ncbi:MAG: hypothetical protein JSS12_05470, partial [Verrucomicrobia bacterium]|nr:hypothetical protein [Verrucomicrobiota bacterium]
MNPVDQLKSLNTVVEQYVQKTNDTKLDHVWLRCVNHQFELVPKTLWNRIKLLFTSAETKQAEYNIVGNIAEIRNLFGQAPKEANFETLENRLNSLIDHVMSKDELKNLPKFEFAATYTKEVAADTAKKAQEAQIKAQQQAQAEQQARARQQEEAKQKAQQQAEEAKQAQLRQAEEARKKELEAEQAQIRQAEEAQRKALEAEQARKQQEINTKNAPLMPLLNQKLYKELGVELDTTKDLVAELPKLLAVDEQLEKLRSKPTWRGFSSEPTQYGKEGTPQAIFLESLRTALKTRVAELQVTQTEDQMTKLNELLTRINTVLKARNSDDKAAKREEAIWICKRFILSMAEIVKERESTLSVNTTVIPEFKTEVMQFDKGSDEYMQKHLRIMRLAVEEALTGYNEDSKFPEKNLMDGFMAFVNEYLPKPQ